MRHPRIDAKIERIARSWLHPSRSDANWLAAVADEVSISRGTPLRTARFSYIALDSTTGERTIGPDSANATVRATRTMLVIDNHHRDEAARRIPALGLAWGRQPVGDDGPSNHVTLHLHPVDEPTRRRRHQRQHNR